MMTDYINKESANMTKVNKNSRRQQIRRAVLLAPYGLAVSKAYILGQVPDANKNLVDACVAELVCERLVVNVAKGNNVGYYKAM